MVDKIKIHSFLLVGMLLIFSVLGSLSLNNYFDGGIVGYSIVSSENDFEKENNTFYSTSLYVLGFVGLMLLVIYSVLLWKHYL